MRCDYCSYPKIEGNKVRLRDPVSVVDEMFAAVAAQPSLSHFFIVDSVFNIPLSHAKAVCRELIARQWTIPWTCYTNPIVIDEEFVALAAQAGCAGMEIGSDAGSDAVLRKLKKGFTTADIRQFRDVCASAGILDCHSFVVGTDGETIDDVRATLDFIADLNPHSAVINIWFDDYESLNGDLRRQRVRLRTEIEELLRGRHQGFPNWSVPALGINFDEQLFRALRRAGYRGPMWQHMAPPGKISRRRSGRGASESPRV
jgi:MoaA/NifB/PqqE/SkfB family radical SAM enzyme